ncbi:DUF5819 family protein [Streptomyces massasporeus]|uniref:DUF5819 family protein n=1 Tax=Streptomyces massasporeus TaxID=67324 RepID=UPI00381E7829
MTEEAGRRPLMGMSGGQRAALSLIGVLAAVAVFFHFTMTALHHTPFNPIREKHDDKIRAYMAPYFQQDWHLFAPEPVSEDSGYLVRAQVEKPDGSVETTQWADVTTPHIDKVQRQRFWPSRVERLAPGVRQRLEGWRDADLDALRREKDPAAPKKTDVNSETALLDPPLAPGELAARDSALLFVRAVASSEARALWGDGVREVQVRVVVNKFPRFSQRSVRTNKGEVSYYDVAWMQPIKVSQ